MKDENMITDPSKITWKCTSIYSFEDIGRIHKVHQAIWGGFVQLNAWVGKNIGRVDLSHDDELELQYALEGGFDDEVVVSIGMYERCTWELNLAKSPDKINSIFLDESCDTTIEFENLGHITFRASHNRREIPMEDQQEYRSLKKMICRFIKEATK